MATFPISNMAHGGLHVGASLAWIFAFISIIFARQFAIAVADAEHFVVDTAGDDVFYADDRSYYDFDNEIGYDLLFEYSHGRPLKLDVAEKEELAANLVDNADEDAREDLPGPGAVWAPQPQGQALHIFPELAKRMAPPPRSRNTNTNTRRSRDTDSGLTTIPSRFVLLMNLGEEVSELTTPQVNDLKATLSEVLNIPESNIHFYLPQTKDTTLALYFVWPDAASSEPQTTADLAPAQQVKEILAQRGMRSLLPGLAVRSVYTRDEEGDVVLDDPGSGEFWKQPYFPYVAAAVAVAILLVIALCVWCCACRHKKQKSGQLFDGSTPTPVSHGSTQQQQICLYPTAKPSVNSATMIQPDMSQINTNKALGTPVRFPPSGSGPSSGSGTPTYSSSQSGTPSLGTPITGCGTPVHTPPLKLKARGLLERRGSNASLTIDISTAMAPDTQWGSPPRESCAEEWLLSAGNKLSRKELRNCLQNAKALHEEFWEIPMNHPDKIRVAGSGLKNRYRTIIPNEHSRVKLPDMDGEPLLGYINANYIRGYAGEAASYIATQGPMSNTVEDFWRMVWQEKAPIIVMITKLKEKHRTKCESYIPETQGVYGSIEVFVNRTSEGDGYILRQLTLKYSQEEHKVLHYWYTAWPDHKAPNTAKQLLDLVKHVESQKCHTITNKPTGPVVVHCSAGIGRTGCFIATSIGVQQLREERMVDVLNIVSSMRIDRGGMVQTNEQYEFVHQALSLFEKELP